MYFIKKHYEWKAFHLPLFTAPYYVFPSDLLSNSTPAFGLQATGKLSAKKWVEAVQ